MGTRTYRVLSIDLYYYSSVGQAFCNFSSDPRSSCYEVGSRVSRDRKSAVSKGGERGGGRSDEANTAGAILLCCRSGDPFQLSSDYSRRLFFLLLLVARLTPANFQYCPKRCVSRLYFHFPRSSSSSSTDRGIIFNPISAHTCVTCGRSRANVVKKLFVEL